VTRSLFSILTVLAIAASPDVVGAQKPSVAGVVRDTAGRPIALAEVNVGAQSTRTDSVGYFYLSVSERDSVTVDIRRIGFQRLTFTLSASEAVGNNLDIVLNILPFALPEVVVEDPGFRSMTPLAGFDERRARGLGSYVTREDIVRRNTYRLSDVLRQQRGVMLTRTRDGRVILQFALARGRRCEPLVWLDGQKAPGLEIDAVAATDVEGIELYQTMATTPHQFVPAGVLSNCGTVVIWTKRPIVKP
jgi:hypothetical protein